MHVVIVIVVILMIRDCNYALVDRATRGIQ